MEKIPSHVETINKLNREAVNYNNDGPSLYRMDSMMPAEMDKMDDSF